MKKELFECNDVSEVKNLFVEKKVPIMEMSNFIPKYTGLPMTIWIHPKTGSEKHGEPRIKVHSTHGNKLNPDKLVSITISMTPEIKSGEGLSNKDFKLVSQWIKQNYKGLMAVWNSKIDPITFILQSNKL